VLASGQRNPRAIAVDRKRVYWLNLGVWGPNTTGGKSSAPWTQGQIVSCSLDGCAGEPSVLADGRAQSIAGRFDGGLATDDAFVYWSDDTAAGTADFGLTTLYRCAAGGCNSQPFALALGGGDGMTLHAGNLYWTDLSPGKLFRCAAASCAATATTLWVSGNTPTATGVAVDDNEVYWTTDAPNKLMKCAVDDCDNTAIVMNPADDDVRPLERVVIDDKNIYFADPTSSGFGKILKCPKSGCVLGRATIIADHLDAPTGIATDGMDIYWTEMGETSVDGNRVYGAGSVRRCDVNGCNNQPVTISSGLEWPYDIALDETHVYWTESSTETYNADGRIWMMAKQIE
jgi:hypothetical protein